MRLTFGGYCVVNIGTKLLLNTIPDSMNEYCSRGPLTPQNKKIQQIITKICCRIFPIESQDEALKYLKSENEQFKAVRFLCAPSNYCDATVFVFGMFKDPGDHFKGLFRTIVTDTFEKQIKEKLSMCLLYLIRDATHSSSEELLKLLLIGVKNQLDKKLAILCFVKEKLKEEKNIDERFLSIINPPEERSKLSPQDIKKVFYLYRNYNSSMNFYELLKSLHIHFGISGKNLALAYVREGGFQAVQVLLQPKEGFLYQSREGYCDVTVFMLAIFIEPNLKKEFHKYIPNEFKDKIREKLFLCINRLNLPSDLTENLDHIYVIIKKSKEALEKEASKSSDQVIDEFLQIIDK